MFDWHIFYTNNTSFLFATPFLSVSLNKRKPNIATLLFVILLWTKFQKQTTQERTHIRLHFRKFHCFCRVVHQTCHLKIVLYLWFMEGRTGLQPVFSFLVSTPSLFPSSYLGSESSEAPLPYQSIDERIWRSWIIPYRTRRLSLSITVRGETSFWHWVETLQAN